MSRYNYTRRKSIAVPVGTTAIGGDNPIRLQSMTNTSTLDTEGSASQIGRIVRAGGEIVRLTTQGEREACNLAPIGEAVRRMGIEVPLVADVHFNPKAAYEAALRCEKVRINPGNFVDPGRTFRYLEYTDAEYEAEKEKITEALRPLIEICREHGTALRLGVNHGSLSDRIMSRYGDTPEGMVESAMEFLRVCEALDFKNVLISIKASNTVVMVDTVRLLVKTMEAENMYYPLHLGVTEAGDGEDGRVKSAVGIGTLLAEGIGDTIRVSLSEDPENEIPVAALLRDYITSRKGHKPVAEPDTVKPGVSRSYAYAIDSAPQPTIPTAVSADFVEIPSDWHQANAGDIPWGFRDYLPVMLASSHANPVGEMQAWIDRFVAAGGKNPIILTREYKDTDPQAVIIKAAADLGTMLLNGYGSGIKIVAQALDTAQIAALELGILQAARLRFSKTEYIACPGCGRTLFDLHSTLATVRKATSHLKGLRIGVMGCIVNGPGEMADADYGYVGAGHGRVSIYKGKEVRVKNLPTEEALPALIDLIKSEGDWIDPAVQ